MLFGESLINTFETHVPKYFKWNHLGFGFGLTYIVPLSIAMKVIFLQIFYIYF